MKDRCCNDKCVSFNNYGGRGINICDEWLEDVNKFLKWSLNNGYKNTLTIERIDNNKGYSPDNCRWATKTEQHNNTRANVFVNIGGVTKTIADWCKVYGIRSPVVYARIYKGWSYVEAFKTPVRFRSKSV